MKSASFNDDFFTNEAKSVPIIRFHREEVSTQTLFYRKEEGLNLF